MIVLGTLQGLPVGWMEGNAEGHIWSWGQDLDTPALVDLQKITLQTNH